MESPHDRLIPTESHPGSEFSRPLPERVVMSPPVFAPSEDKSLPPTPAAGAAVAPGNGHVANNDAAASNGNVPDAQQATDAAKSKHHQKTGKEEKKELMDRMQPTKGSSPLDLAQQKGDRWATDPVTGAEVLIRDPSFKGKKPSGAY